MSKLRQSVAAFAVLFFGLVIAPIAGHADSIAIMNGTVHTVAEKGVIAGGDILIEDGLITNVAENLRPIGDPTIVDARGKVVTPGFFVALTGIGLEEISLDAEASDLRAENGFPLGAALDGTLAFNPRSSVIPVTRAGGITHAFVSPLPGSSIFAGQGFVAEMSGMSSSVVRPRVAQLVATGFGGTHFAGGTRLGVWAIMKEYLDRARAFGSDPAAYRRDENEQRFSLSDIEALTPVLTGEQKLLVGAHRADDLLRIIDLKKAYGLEVIIFGGVEAWRVAAELAEAGIPVVIDPFQNLPAKFEAMAATLENAARLDAAGVKIAFYDSDIGFTHNTRLLPQLAGNAIANGLPYDAAMAAVTRNPAEMFGLADTNGTLEAGKRADLVVWDGDPFEVSSRPEVVIIGGKIMSLETRQTKLRDRYKDLSSDTLPPAYRK